MACGANNECQRWHWYPATYSYDTSFARRCVLKGENTVLTPWNHDEVFSGLKSCQIGIYTLCWETRVFDLWKSSYPSNFESYLS